MDESNIFVAYQILSQVHSYGMFWYYLDGVQVVDQNYL